jgi:predicted O-methyltransferase YrrM
MARMFERAEWQHDRMILDGLVFRIEHHRDSNWDGGEDHFRFYKTQPLVEQYASFFRRHGLAPKRIVELGLWDGGSLAFWCEALQPQKIVGIDIEDREDSAYFRQWVARRSLGERVRTYWNTSQADGAALRRIVRAEFDGPLDCVFDDASHLYAPTKSSFETLFPLLRPGGLYIVEDWAWHHWRELERPKSWQPTEHLTRLVVEATEAVGTNRGFVAGVTVAPGFVAIERGPRAASGEFSLDAQIHRRREPALTRLMTRVVWGPEREALARLKQKLRFRSG